MIPVLIKHSINFILDLEEAGFSFSPLSSRLSILLFRDFITNYENVLAGFTIDEDVVKRNDVITWLDLVVKIENWTIECNNLTENERLAYFDWKSKIEEEKRELMRDEQEQEQRYDDKELGNSNLSTDE